MDTKAVHAALDALPRDVSDLVLRFLCPCTPAQLRSAKSVLQGPDSMIHELYKTSLSMKGSLCYLCHEPVDDQQSGVAWGPCIVLWCCRRCVLPRRYYLCPTTGLRYRRRRQATHVEVTILPSYLSMMESHNIIC